jgi:hypothetical protein
MPEDLFNSNFKKVGYDFKGGADRSSANGFCKEVESYYTALPLHEAINIFFLYSAA